MAAWAVAAAGPPGCRSPTHRAGESGAAAGLRPCAAGAQEECLCSAGLSHQDGITAKAQSPKQAFLDPGDPPAGGSGHAFLPRRGLAGGAGQPAGGAGLSRGPGLTTLRNRSPSPQQVPRARASAPCSGRA